MTLLLEQLKQSLNLRTLYALIALGFLLGVMIIFRLSDAAASAALEREQVESRLARHGGAIDEAAWLQRAEDAQNTLSAWRATRWSGPTAGVVAAELQSALSRVIASAQLSSLAINVEPAPVELPNGTVLRFSVSTDSQNGANVAKTLAALATHEPMLVVNGMNVVFDEDASGRFSISGFAPVSIADVPPVETN